MKILLAVLALSLPPMPAVAASLDDALERFRADFSGACALGQRGAGDPNLYLRRTAITHTLLQDGIPYRVFQILCRGKPTEGTWAFYVASPGKPARLLKFAEPGLGEDAELLGWQWERLRENPVVDAKRRELRFEAWDAGTGRYFRSGVYRFDRGAFRLKAYEVAWMEGGFVRSRKVLGELR